MQTTIKSQQIKTSAQADSIQTIPEFTFWDKIEFNRFGIISMLVVILGCVGGMAAAFGALDNTWKLGMISFPTVISLALVLAVSPMKIIVYASSIALILDLIILFF